MNNERSLAKEITEGLKALEAMRNNEPVAWMLLGLEDRKPKLINLQVIDHLEGTWIPLYTHPADLTDAEINEIVWQQNLLLGNDDLRKFARAILRKAQGK